MTKREAMIDYLSSDGGLMAFIDDKGPGCPTCGYGGGIEIDYEALVDAIEKFEQEFIKKAPEGANQTGVGR